MKTIGEMHNNASAESLLRRILMPRNDPSQSHDKALPHGSADPVKP